MREQGIVGTGQSLAEVSRRVRQGEDVFFAVREFLDGVGLVSETGGDLDALIAERPEPVGDARHDALLGALAEHIALHHDLPVPVWTRDADRFLKVWWFPSSLRGTDAMAIAQSPVAYRRRGIFIMENAFDRC